MGAGKLLFPHCFFFSPAEAAGQSEIQTIVKDTQLKLLWTPTYLEQFTVISRWMLMSVPEILKDVNMCEVTQYSP